MNKPVRLRNIIFLVYIIFIYILYIVFGYLYQQHSPIKNTDSSIIDDNINSIDKIDLNSIDYSRELAEISTDDTSKEHKFILFGAIQSLEAMEGINI